MKNITLDQMFDFAERLPGTDIRSAKRLLCQFFTRSETAEIVAAFKVKGSLNGVDCQIINDNATPQIIIMQMISTRELTREIKKIHRETTS